MLNADKNAQTMLQLMDEKIANRVLNKKGKDTNVVEAESEETILIDCCIELTKELICRMKQESFFQEHDVMSVYKIQETLVLKKNLNI